MKWRKVSRSAGPQYILQILFRNLIHFFFPRLPSLEHIYYIYYIYSWLLCGQWHTPCHRERWRHKVILNQEIWNSNVGPGLEKEGTTRLPAAFIRWCPCFLSTEILCHLQRWSFFFLGYVLAHVSFKQAMSPLHPVPIESNLELSKCPTTMSTFFL